MSLLDFNENIKAVARQLPFEVKDTAAVNALFERWKASPNPADARLLTIWMYCNIHRFYLGKFIRYTFLPEADLDMLISKTLKFADLNSLQIKEEGKFVSWMNVVCKNIFIRYYGQSKTRSTFDLATIDEAQFALEQKPISDLEMTQQIIESAIAKLTPALRQVAQLRLLQNMDYPQIAEMIQKDVPTVRSYMNKINTALRKDENLLALLSLLLFLWIE